MGKTIITPLSIMAGFLSIAEAATAAVATQVTGYAQGAFTTFAVTFPILCLGSFVAILWNKAYVFYPPSEWGEHVGSFIDLMKGLPIDFKQDLKLIAVEQKQGDDELLRFTIADKLVEEAVKQFVILMHEKGISLPFDEFSLITFSTGTDQHLTNGTTNTRTIFKKLDGTDFVHVKPDGSSIVLTDVGHRFAEWLVKNNKKALFHQSNVGSWGTPPLGYEGLGFPPGVTLPKPKPTEPKPPEPPTEQK